jgi:cellulose synthase/poly-beta-1,6-N-acetylglucosamine synthase-like glycosyltransferase
MMALWIFFALAMLLYVAISIALQAGLRRLPERFAESSPTVSILIAARNEEENLPRCLEALLANDYPRERLEILAIDDRSTDGTRRIAEEFARRAGNLRIIPLDRRLDGMSGKASAICQGMDHARGEIILITDADCVPSTRWVRSMVAGFTPEVGMVGGFTVLSDAGKSMDSFLTRVQTVDWIYLLAVGAGAAGLGRPVSILGNNFGFRRVVYETVGGYRSLGFTIIEDFALMSAMLDQTTWRVRFLLTPGATITSQPPLAWRGYIDQRKRWAAGGKEVSGFGKLLLVAGFLRHVATIIALISAKPLLPVIAGIALASLADFLLVSHVTSRLQRREALKHFPFFEIYFLLYSLLLAPVVALPTTVRWKDVTYHWGLGRRTHKIEDPARHE